MDSVKRRQVSSWHIAPPPDVVGGPATIRSRSLKIKVVNVVIYFRSSIDEQIDVSISLQLLLFANFVPLPLLEISRAEILQSSGHK